MLKHLKFSPLRERANPYFTESELWLFINENDDKVCTLCNAFENQTFPGDMLKDTFEHLIVKDDVTISANIHPNCRCKLQRIVRASDVIHNFSAK